MHVAIIMDGNGRWAEQRGWPRARGHEAGVKAFRRTLRAAVAQGVDQLTCFGFSTENWQRPPAEIRLLTGLMERYLTQHLQELISEGIQLRLIGEIERFPRPLVTALQQAVADTAGNSRLVLTVALSYGGRADIVAAARRLAATYPPEEIDEARFSQALATAEIPDPDLLIRTSGELRLSNFMLWQLAYTELVFIDKHWPDFEAADLAAALAIYHERERRWGSL